MAGFFTEWFHVKSVPRYVSVGVPRYAELEVAVHRMLDMKL
jgi:hypothetical protein